MSKILYEKKKGKIKITNKLSYPEEVNMRVYNAIISGMYEGLSPLSIVEKRKETRIECYIQGQMPLTEYFNGLVTKEMFLDIVHKIAHLIKYCEQSNINVNNLDLQCNKIFIEPQSKAVHCIFWPIVNNQQDNPPYIFLKQLPYEINFSPFENNAFLDVYKNFFNGFTPFSVKEFEKLILKLQGKEINKRERTISGFLTEEKKQDKSEMEERKRRIIEYVPSADTDNPSVVYCTSCGTDNSLNASFCIQCGSRLNTEKNIPKKNSANSTTDFGTIVLGDAANGTTVLDMSQNEKNIFPDLVRTRTKERFSINKPAFRIGTEQQFCDLFISDNNYISRSHADIIEKNNRYFIIDKNSTNKTYVDGRVIPIEQEVEIFSGTKLRLANEDFIFLIET